MALDCNVQTRLAKCTLATIAKHEYAKGNFRALKSASALVRWIVEDYASIICQMDQAEAITFSDEADQLLHELGIVTRTDAHGYMQNLQEQNASANASALENAKPSLRTVPRGKLPINMEDDANIRRAFEHALRSTIVKAATAAAAAATETDSEPDEGEFSVEKVREQMR